MASDERRIGSLTPIGAIDGSYKIPVAKEGEGEIARGATPAAVARAGAQTTPGAGVVPLTTDSGRLAPEILGTGEPSEERFLSWDGTAESASWQPVAGGSPTVREVDGAPTVSASTIEFDQAQGLSVADQGGGVARVSVASATTSAKGVVELATDGETAAGVVVQGNDARLSNARTPTAHAASHKNGGADEVAVAAAAANAIPKAGAGGTLAKEWLPAATTSNQGAVVLATPSSDVTAGHVVQASDARLSDARTPTSHTHAAADVVSGTLAAARLPAATTSAQGAVVLSTDRETTAGEVVTADDVRVARPWQRLVLVDHFIAGAVDGGTHVGGPLPWVDIWSNMEPQVIPAESGHPGIYRLSWTNGETTMGLFLKNQLSGGIGIIKAADVDRMGCRIRISHADHILVAFGLLTDFSFNTPPAAAAYGGDDSVLFVCDSAGSFPGTWNSFRRSGGGAGAHADLGATAVGSGWVDLELRRSGGFWRFNIDGTEEGTVSSSTPTAALTPGFFLFNRGNTDTRDLDIDTFWLESVAL
jgi:hypothetical protein